MQKQDQDIDRTLLNDIASRARERHILLASIPMEEIAAALGMSRMTLYRKIGSRQALHDAMRTLGYDPGELPDARMRALQAAADLIRQDGVGALTLEAVAAHAGCALPTIYAQFSSRIGLLTAVFEHHVPVLAVASVLDPVPSEDPAAFRRTVSEAYRVVMDAIETDRGLFRALLAEALRDPSGKIDQFLVTQYVPAVSAHIVPWIVDQMERDVIRKMPVILVLQQFLAPILLHIATRPLIQESVVFSVPDAGDVRETFADLFCRAVKI